MLKFRKHFATFVFALLSLLMLTGFSNVYAEDQTSNVQQYSDNIVNITVPSEMNISFNNQGKATISQFTINNNNLVNLNIDSLNVTGNSWSLIPWNNKPNGNQIAMKLENKELSSTNINNFDGLYVPKNGSKTLNFQVKDRIFKDNVSKQNAFNFNFNFSLGQETFKVNFDTQGGTAVNYISAKNGETITLPSANSSTKTGYTLQYWQINGKNYTPGSSYIVPIGDSTFKAVWSANTYTYNVKYVSSSGKSLGTSTISAKYGETKSVSVPEKPGYTTPASQNVIFDSVNSKTVTFIYQIINYSIEYNLNGGSVSGNPTSYNVESDNITLKNPTKTGYTFTGWTEILKPSNLYDIDFRYDTGTLDEVNGRKAKSSDLISVKQGEKYKFLNHNMLGTRYYDSDMNYIKPLNGLGAADGYIMEKDGYFRYALPEYETYKNQTSSLLKLTNLNSKTTITIPKGSTGNREYVANWKINTYTLTYNANGGSVNATSKSLTYGSQYGNLPTPTRTGYTFNGWYTAASGGSKVSSATTMGAGNITIYAQWKPIYYKIAFDPNGGIFDENDPMWDIIPSYDMEVKLTKNKFTRVGYKFNGWNTKPDGSGVSYSDEQTVKNLTSIDSTTIVLYAQWKPNAYTYNIKYVSSSGKSLGNTTIQGVFGTSTTVNAPSKNGYTKPSSQTVKFDSVNAKTITFTYTPINYKIIYNTTELSGLGGANSNGNLNYFPTTGGQSPNFYNTYSGYVDNSIETLFFPFYSETVKWTFNGVQKPEFNGMSVIDLPDEYKDTRLDIKIEWVDPNNTQNHEGWFLLEAWNTNIPTQYNIESNFKLPDGNPNSSKYEFKGWYDNSSFNGNSITSMTGMYGNKILYPKLEALKEAQKPTVTNISNLTWNQDFNQWYYTSGSLGVNASVTDGGTLTYEWDLYWYTLGTPQNRASGGTQPVKRKITGIPSNMNKWSPYLYSNFDSWWQGSSVDPTQYGPSNDGIARYITVKNTLSNGSSASTKIWVGNTEYQNMYNKAPIGLDVSYTGFSKSLNSLNANNEFIENSEFNIGQNDLENENHVENIPGEVEKVESDNESTKPNEDQTIKEKMEDIPIENNEITNETLKPKENDLNSNDDEGTVQ